MNYLPILILILILIIRVVCFWIPSFSIDMTAWQAWAVRMAELGPGNFYDPNIWTNYTPGYLIFLGSFGLIFNWLNISVFSLPFELIIKLSTTLFDFGTAWIIFRIIEKHATKKMAFIAVVAYLLNPAIIFNSSVWGQIDGVLTFFLMLSFYLLYDLKKVEFSLITFMFSILIKPQALLLAPFYLIGILYLSTVKKMLLGLFYSLVIWLLVSMFFFPKNIFLGLPLLILQMLNDYPYTSLYAFNLWAIIGWWQNDQLSWGGISYQNIGRMIYLIAILLIIVPLKKTSIFNKPAVFYLVIALSVLVFFLFPTRIHERYLFPFFGFFLIAAFLQKSLILGISYIGITIIHLANLWYVYYYYQFIHHNPLFLRPVLFDMLSGIYSILSISMIVLMGITLIDYYRKVKLLK